MNMYTIQNGQATDESTQRLQRYIYNANNPLYNSLFLEGELELFQILYNCIIYVAKIQTNIIWI